MTVLISTENQLIHVHIIINECYLTANGVAELVEVSLYKVILMIRPTITSTFYNVSLLIRTYFLQVSS